jgi:hypothetical protein
MRATNIEWDTHDDGFYDGMLPDEIEIPEGMTDEDEISDYISDVTEFCHHGYVLED